MAVCKSSTTVSQGCTRHLPEIWADGDYIMQADEKLLAPKSGFFGGNLTTNPKHIHCGIVACLTKRACRHVSPVFCDAALACCASAALRHVRRKELLAETELFFC